MTSSASGVVAAYAYALCAMAALCATVPRRAMVGGAPVAPDAYAVDDETIIGGRHFARGHPTRNADGSINAVIEIPCGTTAKFEVDDDTGWLRWQLDRDDGSRRQIDYLAFPLNYGMVPRTLAADGDALDIVVLGRAIDRAHVAPVRVIGVLKMADGDAHDIRDDKLIAVALEPSLASGFSRLRDLPELDAHYPEVRSILLLWFSSYWGEGATHVLGWGDAAEAAAILADAEQPITAPVRTARPAAAGPRPREPRPSVARAH